jgi:hypothetical protein
VKCVDRLAAGHTAQCLDYLRAFGLRLGLLVSEPSKPFSFTSHPPK